MPTKLLWIAKNLARMLCLLIAVSIAAFALASLSPVDPLAANVGQTALGSMSGEQIAKLERYWGVDEPPVSRYLAWAGDFLRGDMGESLLYRRSVSAVIGEKLANSLWLMLFAWAASGVTGLALGLAAGVNRGRLSDRLIKGFALVTASTPAFWLALLALLLFSVRLGLFPIGLAVPIGMESAAVSLADRLRHAVLPAAVLSVVSMSGVILHTREKTIACMESDYALFALARGETRRRVAWRHGLRNVLLPAVTLQFAAVSEIFGGSVLVEQVFSYPGLGKAAVAAGIGGDLPLLLGITVISAAVVFAGNLTANLLYGVIDPRIRRGRSA